LRAALLAVTDDIAHVDDPIFGFENPNSIVIKTQDFHGNVSHYKERRAIRQA